MKHALSICRVLLPGSFQLSTATIMSKPFVMHKPSHLVNVLFPADLRSKSALSSIKANVILMTQFISRFPAKVHKSACALLCTRCRIAATVWYQRLSSSLATKYMSQFNDFSNAVHISTVKSFTSSLAASDSLVRTSFCLIYEPSGSGGCSDDLIRSEATAAFRLQRRHSFSIWVNR